MPDYIAVGLGNPGPKYAESRHNVGASCISMLAKRFGASMHSSSLAHYGHVTICEADVLLIRPRTWYNSTGRAVQYLIEREPVPMGRLLVIYDEVELAEGVVDLQRCGGHAGNNGLKSIIDTLGQSDFRLIQIGVGGAQGMPRSVYDPNFILRHVLSPPSQEVRDLLDAAVERACEAAMDVVRSGWDAAAAKTPVRQAVR